MIDQDESVSGGKWTDEENVIFLQHVMDKPEVVEGNCSKQLITELTSSYNESARQAVNLLQMNSVRQKDERQVKKKLQHLEKRKELALLLIEEQINISMTNLVNLSKKKL